jgi:hypothetical protein
MVFTILSLHSETIHIKDMYAGTVDRLLGEVSLEMKVHVCRPVYELIDEFGQNFILVQ